MNAAYAMFKAALNNMVLSMQKEFLRDKIRINSINPGLVKTKLAEVAFITREFKEYEYGKPEDIAAFVGVICSE